MDQNTMDMLRSMLRIILKEYPSHVKHARGFSEKEALLGVTLVLVIVIVMLSNNKSILVELHGH